jgi:hypothetical protein
MVGIQINEQQLSCNVRSKINDELIFVSFLSLLINQHQLVYIYFQFIPFVIAFHQNEFPPLVSNRSLLNSFPAMEF